MVKTTRTTWRSTLVSSFLSEEACWLPLQHATWVRVLFFLSQVVTFLYYKWTQVVVSCFCGSGTGQKYIEGKNMFRPCCGSRAIRRIRSGGGGYFEAGASQCSIQRSIEGTDRTVP